VRSASAAKKHAERSLLNHIFQEFSVKQVATASLLGGLSEKNCSVRLVVILVAPDVYSHSSTCFFKFLGKFLTKNFYANSGIGVLSFESSFRKNFSRLILSVLLQSEIDSQKNRVFSV